MNHLITVNKSLNNDISLLGSAGVDELTTVVNNALDESLGLKLPQSGLSERCTDLQTLRNYGGRNKLVGDDLQINLEMK